MTDSWRSSSFLKVATSGANHIYYLSLGHHRLYYSIIGIHRLVYKENVIFLHLLYPCRKSIYLHFFFRKAETKISLICYLLPEYPQQQGLWTRLEPGVQNSVWLSHVDGRELLLPRVHISRALESGVELVLKPGTQIWNTGISRSAI